MLKKFFTLTTFTAVLLWYLHEYHTAKFIQVTRNIPYITPLMRKIHNYLGSGSNKTEVENILFSVEHLQKYNGEEGSKGVYIAILGKVFDVKKGKHHYGPGGTYHVFAGRDASKSFITGDFTSETSTDDVMDLSSEELLSLVDWVKFYEKEYIYKGKLIGRFYDESGKETTYYKKLKKKLKEAKEEKKNKQNDELEFPPCNVEWTAERGTKVWCSNRSGGIQRDWVGVPRRLYRVGSDTFRCACIDLDQLDNPNSIQYARRGHLQEYENCDIQKSTCYYK